MKSITIIAEQISDRALTAALPATGIASVAIKQNPGLGTGNSAVESYRALGNPRRFRANYRIELIVAEDAVESVFDGIAVAYGAGLFSDAEMWVDGGALASAA